MNESKDLSLAIEASGREHSIAIGRGDALLFEDQMPKAKRHNVSLMPTVAAAFERLSLSPASLAEVYVSRGPGSFTGLRIGVATAKMLAMTLGCRLVGVESMDAMLANVPDEIERVAIGLNHKRGSVYGGVFERLGESWREQGERRVDSVEAWLRRVERPAAVLGQQLDAAEVSVGEDLRWLPESLTTIRASAVWDLGRALGNRGVFVSPQALSPLYVREPEAVSLWRMRHGSPPTT